MIQFKLKLQSKLLLTNMAGIMEKFLSRLLDYKVKNVSTFVDEVERPSGAITSRIVIDYPNAVAIIPFISPNKFILVKQYRYALQQVTLEFPAGKIDPGETSEQAVVRELIEETGYRPESIKKIYSYAPAMGYSKEIVHLYFASNLVKTDQYPHPDEIQSLSIHTKDDLWEMIGNGKLLDPDIIIGLLYCEKLGLI